MLQKSSGVQRRIFRKGKISFMQEIFVLYFGVTDPRTPFHAKLIAWAALVYLISPIDLIPDFIPVAGYLDDLVIVPLLLHAAYAVLPLEVKESGRTKARKHATRLYIALIIALIILLAMMASIFLLIKNLLHF
jgi:uncharacterized membrane protein YkvA (DUF1232 family)